MGVERKKEVVQQARNNPQNQGPIISCVPFSKGSVLRLGGFPEAGKLKEREGRDEKEVRRDKGVKKKNVSHVQGDHLEGGKNATSVGAFPTLLESHSLSPITDFREPFDGR